ncbi:hypothetical protein Mapa_007573 [Marchantia paleacea]|nr:hypothetical protein Mapa_007573 [Marchantia paleacea]
MLRQLSLRYSSMTRLAFFCCTAAGLNGGRRLIWRGSLSTLTGHAFSSSSPSTFPLDISWKEPFLSRRPGFALTLRGKL